MNADHGTRARYAQGCHCTDCRAANTAYQRARRRQQPRRRLLRAETARRELTRRLDNGDTVRGLARRLGLNRTTVVAIVSGQRTTLQRSTIETILAGQPKTPRTRKARDTYRVYPRRDLGTFTRAELLALRAAS